MARLYLKRTLSGFVPADEPSAELARKYKTGEVYRADVVKPRSYQHHKLCMALLTLTYQNQERYTNFDMFRKAVALEAGHVNEIIKLDGEVVLEPGSLSYDALDEVEFTRVMGAMMTICARILDVSEPERAGDGARYADEDAGAVA